MKMLIHCAVFLTVVFGFCHVLSVRAPSALGLAQSASNPIHTPTPIRLENLGPFGWALEAWTGDEKPFTLIRHEIDAQIQSGKNPQSLLKRYKDAALVKPSDAQSQFRWAYTAFTIFNTRWQSGKDEREALKGVHEAMEKPTSPKSYEYARVRVFMNEWDSFENGNRLVRECVFRLLKRNPKDDLVKYDFSFSMSLTSNLVKDQDIAYLWAKEYLAKFPAKPQAYYQMGYVLTSRFDRFQTMKMAQAAIENLKKCQKMLPADHFYQKRIQMQLTRVGEGVKIFRKVGKLKE